jgi:sulfur carrier protein ThiS
MAPTNSATVNHHASHHHASSSNFGHGNIFTNGGKAAHKNKPKNDIDSYGYLGRMKQIVVLVDPYSSGCLVGQEVSKRGYLLIRVWSAGICDIMKGHQPVSCQDLRYYDTITVDDLLAQQDQENAHGKAVSSLSYNQDGTTTLVQSSALELAAAAIRESADDLEIVSVIAGGDRGVDFADALSEHFGLLTNGTSIPNRRDKKIQQELCRAAGLRAARQAGGDKFEDVEAFLRTEAYPLVVKPLESSGSDGVKLCQTFDEAKQHFDVIMQTCMVDGGKNTGAVAQEFLRGKEYIVDMVSCDGIHKCFMVFVYDKRPANGAMFVYYGCIPVDSESPEAKLLIPYTKGVLDAIGVK